MTEKNKPDQKSSFKNEALKDDILEQQYKLALKHKNFADDLSRAQDLMGRADEARRIVRETSDAGTFDKVTYDTAVFANGHHTQSQLLDSAELRYNANMWEGHDLNQRHYDVLRDAAKAQAELEGKIIKLDIGEQAVDAATRLFDIEAKSEIPDGIEFGERVRFRVGFDKAKLASLNVDKLLDAERFDRENTREQAEERIRRTINIFSHLPEDMSFEPGMTAIFGENGAGKTVLADVLVMALEMQAYSSAESVPYDQLMREDDYMHLDRDIQQGKKKLVFYPHLPGRARNNSGFEARMEEAHTNLIFHLAKCLDVKGAVIRGDNKFTFSNALRSTSAMDGLPSSSSTRQGVDMFRMIRKESSADRPVTVTIIDEPEMGMSPSRQRGLVNELKNDTQDGSAYLVPSNATVLFEEKTIPRIDLDHPEKGVHYPV